MSQPSVASLNLEEKIGQLMFIGIPADSITSETERLLEQVKPGGVCLFARNIKDARQTRDLNESLREMSAVVPFISVDQEGGLVDRLRRLLNPSPAASRLDTPEAVRRHAQLISEALLVLGFNMNFAPVVDVIDADRGQFSNGLHSRAYGKSAEAVSELAGTFLDTLQSNGLIGCIKHFPGLGASNVDSHEELPVVEISTAELYAVDLLPYKHLIENGAVRCVMVAHAAFSGLGLQETSLDGKLLPSSLSYAIVTQLLREKFEFDGLVITDDLEMGAIVKNFGIGDASFRAAAAGNDMVSICAGVDAIKEGHEALMEAAARGRLATERIDASVNRILSLKNKLRSPVLFDLDRISVLAAEVEQFNQSLTS